MLLDGDEARTPATEPAPGAAVDRLVLLRLTPGEQRHVGVTLRGACAGTMAALTDDSGVALSSARTCVDREAELVAVAAAPDQDGPTVLAESQQGSYTVDEPCDDDGSGDAGSGADGTAAVVCVPGGTFVLGGPEWGGVIIGSSMPEQLARVRRFWLDRYEVTVARWRQVLSDGFEPASFPPLEHGYEGFPCTWTSTPGGREDHPLTCVDWHSARSFCQFRGGDLPTEAQWEYAAGAAGRPSEVRYPWGNDAPACTCAAAGTRPCHSANIRFDRPTCPDGAIRPVTVDDQPQRDINVFSGAGAGAQGGGRCWPFPLQC